MCCRDIYILWHKISLSNSCRKPMSGNKCVFFPILIDIKCGCIFEQVWDNFILHENQIPIISFDLCIIDWQKSSPSFVDFWSVWHLNSFYFHKHTTDLPKVLETKDTLTLYAECSVLVENFHQFTANLRKGIFKYCRNKDLIWLVIFRADVVF